MSCVPPRGASCGEPLADLVYELLDAHQDTMDLADGLSELRWRAHLDYLRALARTGRELLARSDQARGDHGRRSAGGVSG
jgi:hypothetical protein